MTTYPIYVATFSGSNDYMAHAIVKVAAVNITQAIKRFREWDAETRGVQGSVGSLIYKDKEHGWCRPAKITAEHITKHTDLRAIRKDYWTVS